MFFLVTDSAAKFETGRNVQCFPDSEILQQCALLRYVTGLLAQPAQVPGFSGQSDAALQMLWDPESGD